MNVRQEKVTGLHRRLGNCLIAGLVLSALILLLPSPLWSKGLKGFASGEAQAQLTPSSEPGFSLGKQWLQRYVNAESIDALFKMVAEDIRFEPYNGILRGPEGTALSHKGNSLDQALLLKKVLAIKGYKTRLVEGALDQANARVLIRGMYPPQLPSYNYSHAYTPFRPEHSAPLMQTVSKHYWVELDQGSGRWLPLDPSFPRAKIGEAYAKVGRYYDQPLPEWHQTVIVRLFQKTMNNRTKKLFDIEKPVSELGYRPISLSCMGMPLESGSSRREKGTGSALGLFGESLGGGSKKQEKEQPDTKRQIVGTRYQWSLNMRGEGQSQSAHSLSFSKKDGLISREWLEITFKIPGQPSREIDRILYAAIDNKPQHQPRMYRRYLLEVLPGSMRPELAEERARQFGALSFKKWEKSLEQAKQGSDQSTALAIDERLGSSLLQMLITRFSEASDEASDRAAYNNGVLVVRSHPRVLIASAEQTGEKLELSMDLRVDEVEAIPYPGAPARVSSLYQTGRGIMQSKMEGKILEKLTGQKAVTTAELMAQAQSQGIPLKVVGSSSLNAFIKASGIPSTVREHMKSSVSNGNQIIVPQRAVTVAGANRWGWWQLENATGRSVGVMDNGLHAAMAEYTFSTEKIGVNPDMGFAIGMIVGADSTLFTISGLMLKYGQANEAMIQEVENYLEKIMCISCPKAELSASAGVSASAGCLSVGKKAEATVAKASIDFCEKYVNGFKCAAGLLMSGLTGSGNGRIEAKVETSIEAGCSSAGQALGAGHDF